MKMASVVMLYCTSVINHVLDEENHSDCVFVHAHVLTGLFSSSVD